MTTIVTYDITDRLNFQKKFKGYDQAQFEQHCRRRMRDYFSKFTTRIGNIDAKDQNRVRHHYSWHDAQTIVEKALTTNATVNVLVG